MSRRFVRTFFALLLAGCASQTRAVPANISFSGSPSLPNPVPAANGAPPKILAMHFSGDEVKRGETWSGEIVTTTNVASVEVRSNLFSINVPRRGFGRFAFTLRVYDVPPIFVRAYQIRVIARNSAGQPVEEHFPFRIR
jgi:hypothetical protein